MCEFTPRPKICEPRTDMVSFLPRNGVVTLQIKGFSASDVGTYECFAKNEHGDMSQPVIMVMAQVSRQRSICG